MHINDILDLPNLQDVVRRFEEKFVRLGEDDCWNWTAAAFGDGYGAFMVAHKSKHYAHRVAYVLYRGPIPGKLGRAKDCTVCRHTCDNRRCVNPKHIIVGLQVDNVKDAYDRGRSLVGEPRWNSKLTEKQVREVLAAPASVDNVELGERYGVTHWAIRSIRNGRNWKHLDL